MGNTTHSASGNEPAFPAFEAFSDHRCMSHPLGTLNTEAGGRVSRAAPPNLVSSTLRTQPRGSASRAKSLVHAGPGGRRRGRVGAGSHPGPGRRQPGDARGARPVAHLLRARPRPHPALAAPSAASPARRQVFVFPRRPPAHPAHPRARGGPGGGRHRPRRCGLNVALTEAIALGHDCGHGPGGHAIRGGAVAVPRRAATTTPCGAPTSCSRRSTCAPRRSTASATTRGTGRRRPRPRARSWPGPTASPTSATTSRTPWPPASWSRRDLPAAGARARAGTDRRAQLGAFITAMVDAIGRHGPRRPCRPAEADALAAFRAFNYERIYLRPERRCAGRAR